MGLKLRFKWRASRCHALRVHEIEPKVECDGVRRQSDAVAGVRDELLQADFNRFHAFPESFAKGSSTYVLVQRSGAQIVSFRKLPGVY